MITVLIFGGQDTTQCQLACAVATFVAHPEQWALLAKEPGLAASATEEILRYEPAGSGSPRIATEDFRYRDLEVKAGTIALPSGPAANRDPAVYPDPDRFDITRRHAEPHAHLRRRRPLLPRRGPRARRAAGGAADPGAPPARRSPPMAPPSGAPAR